MRVCERRIQIDRNVQGLEWLDVCTKVRAFEMMFPRRVLSVGQAEHGTGGPANLWWLGNSGASVNSAMSGPSKISEVLRCWTSSQVLQRYLCCWSMHQTTMRNVYGIRHREPWAPYIYVNGLIHGHGPSNHDFRHLIRRSSCNSCSRLLAGTTLHSRAALQRIFEKLGT